MDRLRPSWSRAWQAVRGPDDAPLFERLIAAWSEAHRRYHTLQHLAECVATMGTVARLAVRPTEVELAIWFHDAVYDVRSDANEVLSAGWVRQVARDADAPPEVAERLHDLVMATRHDGVPASPDEALLVDIDLSILGASADRFDEYERQIREEYAWVPEADFRRRRRDVLARFLARPAIYRTAHFRGVLESQARENLARSIEQLDP
ncbi:MAG TPA: N-methyl-D-aspartate receptor NMDAR2C subunit [Caldimonas sp.]|jgi:predicted metal-dependent HD superfamily phosphohydrolase|nr:N-methyl-D-aspartate receptor NMDAR2C subunit [Caldimonas sp.]HEX2539833.1 N-methyl-D-aspartate receptor NMDAR2C subunit [Caldimonas sp.]